MNNSANDFNDVDQILSSSYISKVSQSSVEHNVKQYKVIFIGNINVGKTSIIKRYVTKRFNDKYTPSVGIAYERIKIKVNSTSLVKLNLWDTAGNEKYKSVTKTHFNGADVVLFVYDITDEQSFTELSSWITTVNEMCGEGSYLSYILANKTDLNAQRTISTSRGSVYANTHGCTYTEISAKTGANIDELFTSIAEALYNKSINTKPKDVNARSRHSSVSLHVQQRLNNSMSVNTRKRDLHQSQESKCC